MELLRITTAGSVDDGKSTLIGRLLFEAGGVYTDQWEAVKRTSAKRGMPEVDYSLLTDGLSAEREQNITIDVAYRYLTLGDKKIIIADVPGHEQYTRNMVTGASTADLAIILVDANKGLFPQTIQHLYIACLLRIPQIVIAVNKMDNGGYQQKNFDKISTDVRRWFANTPLNPKPSEPIFVPVSAIAGDMIVGRGNNMPWYNGLTLLEIIKTAKPAPAARDFRMPVQMVLRSSIGRRYAGQIAGGEISLGDKIAVLPNSRQVRVMGIYLGAKKLGSAQAGMSISVEVDQHIDLSRGDLLAGITSPSKVNNKFTAAICWLSNQRFETLSFKLKHGYRDSRASVRIINESHSAASFCQGAIVKAEISTHIPLIYDPYSQNRSTGSLILINDLTNDTVAAGLIES